jgi:hypothetical protein
VDLIHQGSGVNAKQSVCLGAAFLCRSFYLLKLCGRFCAQQILDRVLMATKPPMRCEASTGVVGLQVANRFRVNHSG